MTVEEIREALSATTYLRDATFLQQRDFGPDPNGRRASNALAVCLYGDTLSFRYLMRRDDGPWRPRGDDADRLDLDETETQALLAWLSRVAVANVEACADLAEARARAEAAEHEAARWHARAAELRAEREAE